MHVDLSVLLPHQLTIQQRHLTNAHRQCRILRPEEEGHQHREGQREGGEGGERRGLQEILKGDRGVDRVGFGRVKAGRRRGCGGWRGEESSPHCTHIV